MSSVELVTILAILCWRGTPVNAQVTSNIEIKHVVQAPYCSNQVLVPDHIRAVLPVRSKVECLAYCRVDRDCVSVVYNQRTHQCHLGDSRAYENCTNMEPADSGASFYQEPPPCVEGREVRGSSGLCVCAPGFDGDPCTRYFHDCADHYNYGRWTGDGIYEVHPRKFPQPFEVYCRHITNTRVHVMVRKRNKNPENFDRPWLDYTDGFGNLYNDFWIGLKKLHALTTDRSYKLRILIKLANTTSFLHIYENFKITDETTGYRLFFDTAFLNGPNDCLLPLLNAKFSTYDHDRDEAKDVNCAAMRKGGFWFRGSDCSACNPHGILYKADDGLLVGREDEAFWAFLGEVAPDKIYMYLVPHDDV